MIRSVVTQRKTFRQKLDPGVTVLVCTYNSISTIAETLKGIITQKVNFPLQILLHDDASTDGTIEFVKTLAENSKVPIQIIRQTINQFQFGVDFYFKALSSISTEFIAICDGDDVWTDPHKLAKQFKYLKEFPEIPLCHHKFLITNLLDGSVKAEWPPQEFCRDKVNGILLARENFIGSLTVMLRRSELPGKIKGYGGLKIGDYPIWAVMSDGKKIGFINEIMANYFQHPDQSFASNSPEEKMIRIKNAVKVITKNVRIRSRSKWKDALKR